MEDQLDDYYEKNYVHKSIIKWKIWTAFVIGFVAGLACYFFVHIKPTHMNNNKAIKIIAARK
jgi:hypothetical protein